MKVNPSFYLHENVVSLAQDLLGYNLYTYNDQQLCGVTIAETEAYAGITDRASHAYGGRYTKRTATMYKAGGIAYVYLCYGIHHLLNVVTAGPGIPHAVLIRGAMPHTNLAEMKRRMGTKKKGPPLLNGPGKLSKALGIKRMHDGLPLDGDTIWITQASEAVAESSICIDKRIGIGYAAEDAALPYRFYIKDYWQ